MWRAANAQKQRPRGEMPRGLLLFRLRSLTRALCSFLVGPA